MNDVVIKDGGVLFYLKFTDCIRFEVKDGGFYSAIVYMNNLELIIPMRGNRVASVNSALLNFAEYPDH
ncbi:hypothetical protein ACKOZB_003626, partial [Vibrio parahaemolyticus]